MHTMLDMDMTSMAPSTTRPIKQLIGGRHIERVWSEARQRCSNDVRLCVVSVMT